MYLVKCREINQTTDGINQKYQRKCTDFQVLNLNSKDIYGHLPLIWTYRNESIFITLKLPLVSPVSKIHLYKVHYFSVPLKESTDHATKLSAIFPYFAATSNNVYYAFRYETTIAQIQSNILMFKEATFLRLTFKNNPVYQNFT